MSKYEVTEADYNAAVAHASPFARQRLFRKMGKRPMPKDVEQYVENFVLLYKDGPARPGSLVDVTAKSEERAVIAEAKWRALLGADREFAKALGAANEA